MPGIHSGCVPVRSTSAPSTSARNLASAAQISGNRSAIAGMAQLCSVSDSATRRFADVRLGHVSLLGEEPGHDAQPFGRRTPVQLARIRPASSVEVRLQHGDGRRPDPPARPPHPAWPSALARTAGEELLTRRAEPIGEDRRSHPAMLAAGTLINPSTSSSFRWCRTAFRETPSLVASSLAVSGCARLSWASSAPRWPL